MINSPLFGSDATGYDYVELAQAGFGENVGVIDTIDGTVTIVRVDGTVVTAETNIEIYLGDVVSTDSDGAIGIVFLDGTSFSLAENGQMSIDEMVYDPDTQSGSSVIGVAEGVFTFISGEIAKTDVEAMVIETPVASIGIRGSAGGGRIVNPLLLDPDSTFAPSGTFSNFRDPVTGEAGELIISTPTGAQVLSGVNATTNVPNPYVPPSIPVTLPGSALNSVFGRAASSLPQPSNSPSQQQGDAGTPAGLAASLTQADPPAPGQTLEQTSAEAAAAQAFEDALAGGVDLAVALEVATEVAGATIARFGMDITNLDNFSEQTAIEEIIAATVNDQLGGLGNFGPANPLSAGSGESKFAADAGQLSETVNAIVDFVVAETQFEAFETQAELLGGFAASGLIDGNFVSDTLTGQLLELESQIEATAALAEDALASGDLEAFNAIISQAEQDFQEFEANLIEDTVDDVVLSLEDQISDVDRNVFISGTATVTLQANVNDSIFGSVGDDALTLDGQAETGDGFFGQGGTDSVTLDTFSNVFLVEAVSNIKLPLTSATQTIAWSDAGSMTLSNASGSTSAPDAPFKLAGTNLTGTGDLNQTLTIGFQMPASNANAQASEFSLSTGTDTVILANGENQIVSNVGVETWQLTGGGTNTLTIEDHLTGATVTGSTSIDNVVLYGVGSDDTVNLDAADDVLILYDPGGSPILDGGTHTGSDKLQLNSDSSLTLADSFFTNVTGFENFSVGSSQSYNLTLGTAFGAQFSAINFESAATSVTMTLNASAMTTNLTYNGQNNTGVDNVTGGSGVDTIKTGGGVDQISASAGGDIITAGDGADSVSLGAGSDTIIINTTSEFGDTIQGFSVSGTDVLDINVTVSRGDNSAFESLASGATVGTNSAFVNYTTSVTNYTDEASVATELNGLSGLASGNVMLFAVGNGTNTRVWYWADAAAGGGNDDGVVDWATELFQVADLSSFDNTSNLTASNTEGFV